MKKRKTEEWKYIVWVGGIDDYYETYLEAEAAAKKFKDQGYDDVVIEKVN